MFISVAFAVAEEKLKRARATIRTLVFFALSRNLCILQQTCSLRTTRGFKSSHPCRLRPYIGRTDGVRCLVEQQVWSTVEQRVQAKLKTFPHGEPVPTRFGCCYTVPTSFSDAHFVSWQRSFCTCVGSTVH
jgi:hypothetical protein